MTLINCEKYKQSNPNVECNCKDCNKAKPAIEELKKYRKAN